MLLNDDEVDENLKVGSSRNLVRLGSILFGSLYSQLDPMRFSIPKAHKKRRIEDRRINLGRISQRPSQMDEYRRWRHSGHCVRFASRRRTNYDVDDGLLAPNQKEECPSVEEAQ